MSKKYSHFELLLDKTGTVLHEYLQQDIKDPPPWELCKQLIEKSIAVAAASTTAQGVTESELKVYEAQRIWHPLSLAITICSHLKWNLDVLQNNVLLHLQQILMEELLKDYGIAQIPKPEDFDISKYEGRIAMVHIIYNRWIVRNLTKYEAFKVEDVLPNNLSALAKETKEAQEFQIINTIKTYRNLALDILEKSVHLTSDVEIPYPLPRLVTATQIKTQVELTEDGGMALGVVAEDGSVAAGVVAEEKKSMDGTLMKLPEILEKKVMITADECVLNVCFDLGCYYFPKELYNDALRSFRKALQITQRNPGVVSSIDMNKLLGYYQACCGMTNEKIDATLQTKDLSYRLNECIQKKEYNVIPKLLKEDNLKQELPITQRMNIETEVCSTIGNEQLFLVCVLNFIRNCIDGNVISNALYQALNVASDNQVTSFVKECADCYQQLTNVMFKEKLKKGVQFAFLYLSDISMKSIEKSKCAKVFLTANQMKRSSPKKKVKKDKSSNKSSARSTSVEVMETDNVVRDERISAVIQLKAKLVSCFEPETIKDILFELHDIPPEQSHAKGFECEMYEDIFVEVRDLLMYDTVLVCVTKAKQLVRQNNTRGALSLLNICVETLNSYATRASPGCSVARVKNILHHELLWTELKILLNGNHENVNEQETMRRCKACIKHRQQDPPPRPHIYKAIVIHLLNCKEYQFLVEAGSSIDFTIVDYLQLAFHLSSVVYGLQRGVDVMRAAAKDLWQAIVAILSVDMSGTEGMTSPTYTSGRSRRDEEHMWNNCLITRDGFISLLLEIKDDSVLSLLLSCLTSVLCLTKKDFEMEIKDSYSHFWPTSLEGNISINRNSVLSVLRCLSECCIRQNSRNISSLKTIADVYLVEGDYKQAMQCYLEVGSIATSFFSRPVPFSVWDEKIYRNMIKCCQKEKAFTQVMVMCQFTEPVDYTTAFKAIQESNCEDAMDSFYDCLWDMNILEYLIYAHDKRGEIEKRQLAIKVVAQPELNSRGSPDLIKQSQDIRKTRFLRALTRIYWK